MPVKVDRDLCTSCGSCVEECPVEAIELDSEEIATVDDSLCIDCGSCIEVCPVEAIDWA